MAKNEDIFDVVDASDNVVASMPRSAVHARGLMHRASHIIVFNGVGDDCGSADAGCGAGTDALERKILLQKRSPEKDLYPNLYTTSCSGHVDSGEDYDTAAVREMREETGVSISASDLLRIGKISPCAETGNEFTFVYVMNLPETTRFIPQPEEVAALEWVCERDFRDMIARSPELFTPSFLKVYNFYLSRGAK